MPKPKNLSRECEHTWAEVGIEEQVTTVGDVVLDKTDVYFCHDCNSVLEEV